MRTYLVRTFMACLALAVTVIMCNVYMLTGRNGQLIAEYSTYVSPSGTTDSYSWLSVEKIENGKATGSFHLAFSCEPNNRMINVTDGIFNKAPITQ